MTDQCVRWAQALIVALLLTTATALPLAAEPTSAPTDQIKCDAQEIAALKANQRLLHVKGMVCGMCVQGISKKLTALQGVADAEINLERGAVLVTLKAKAEVKDETLMKAIERSGYEVQDLHRPQPK